jgi:hypothetical protein
VKSTVAEDNKLLRVLNQIQLAKKELQNYSVDLGEVRVGRKIEPISLCGSAFDGLDNKARWNDRWYMEEKQILVLAAVHGEVPQFDRTS